MAGEPMAIAVLVGGRGRRLGGDKLSLRVGGRPVLTHLLGRLGVGRGDVVLIARPGQALPSEVDGLAIAHDDGPGDGPLRGIAAALGWIGARHFDRVAVLTIDMPFVDRALLDGLGEALTARGDAGGVMCRSRDGIEPFPCVLRATLIDVVRERLAAGRLAVHWLADDGVVALIDPPADVADEAWTNVNAPADLADRDLSFG